MNKFQSFRAYLIYRQAVIKADAAHKKTGQRYYVLPCASSKILLVVADRKNFRLLQRKHYINDQWNLDDVKARSFYYTADKGGNGAPTDEILKNRQFIYQYWFDVRLQEKRTSRQSKRRAIWDRLAGVFK